MKAYLFPNRFKILGYIIFSIGLLASLVLIYNEFEYEPELFDFKMVSLYSSGEIFQKEKGYFIWTNQNIFNELCSILLILGGIFIGFSKEKIEDEFIKQLRLNALATSVYANYGILALAFLFVHGLDFFHVMVYNMFTLLFIFIIVFHINFKKLSDGR
jgi:hypothetical protein